MNRPHSSTYFVLLLALSHANVAWCQTTSVSTALASQKTQSLVQVPVKIPVQLYWGYAVIAEGSIGNMRKLNFLQLFFVAAAVSRSKRKKRLSIY